DITSTTATLENNSKLRQGSRKQRSKGWCKELKKDGSLCNHVVETDGDMENFSDHLQNKHEITKFGRHESYISQLANNEKSHQIKDNGIYKEQVDKALVKFIVTNSQPFYMLENLRFIKYSLMLSPSYKLPKVVRRFIGVTCLYIDPQFEMQEITLAIHELKHLHSGFTIAITLKSILQNWGINEKCFMITTDNAKNIIKAINKIEVVN
ncbi:6717_t:CDS:2, partial [Cetraspora pellucida]